MRRSGAAHGAPPCVSAAGAQVLLEAALALDAELGGTG
jgi:hypothetical protein